MRTLRFVLVLLLIVAGLSVVAGWFFLHSSQSGPEVVTSAPSFELTDETGAKFGDQDLKGQAYVVQFFFTSCTTVCPRITDWMTRIQDRTKSLGDQIRLVSITVDPRHDTPEKLMSYAKGYGAIPGHWKFLTGDLDAVQKVVVDGFFQVMEPQSDQKTGLYNIAHSERFILVDQVGRVRGYYEANEKGVDKLVHDLNAVVQEKKT
jgi:protein SCO1/2